MKHVCQDCAGRRLSGFGVATPARMQDTPAAARARGEAAIAAVRAMHSKGLGAYMAAGPEGMRRMFMDPRFAGFGVLGISQSAGGAAEGTAAGAKVGSAIAPGIGTAIGAVVGAVAGALFSKKKDPNAAEKEALKGNLDKYMQVQGQVPGRAMDLLGLKQLIDGAGYRGLWPNVKKWSGDAITGAIDGCKGCTPPTIRQFVKDQVAAGDIDPFSLANKFTDLVNRTWGSKWFVATAGPTQRQLMVDLMDYFIAQNKPDAPLYYAPDWTVAANTPPPASTAPTPVQTLPAAQTTPTVSTQQASTDTSAAAMAAYQAALQQLAAQGVPITPQVQQQVAAQTGVTSAGLSLPSWAVPVGIGAGVLVLVFALAHPAPAARWRRR